MNKIHPCEQLCGNGLLNWPWPVGGAQRAVGRHGDALRVAVVDQLLLGQVWVAFDLGGCKQRQKHVNKKLRALITLQLLHKDTDLLCLFNNI